MPDVGELIAHWGYPAIFLFVVLGNLGLPVPEETILALSGYLVWRGDLRLPSVLAVGIISAAIGDNVGYWLGREFGRGAIERYGHRVGVTPARLESVWRFVTRYGALGIFVARFIPGLRFLAGPLAGAARLRPFRFIVANLLGAALYVPYAVGIGYAIGYGLGAYVERIRRVEYLVLLAAALVTLGLLGRRALRRRRLSGGGAAPAPSPRNPGRGR